MATTAKLSAEQEEEYIDMELISSSPKNREFEFQMSSSSSTGDKQTTNTYCPADELFYNGKLLPLHSYKILPFTAPCTNTTNTPLDSCNISPSESCRVSCELNPDDYYFQWSTELTQFNGFVSSSTSNHHHHHSASSLSSKRPPIWSKKLKLIKHSVLGQKLKASRAYFKSLFTKSACSDETSANAGGEKAAEMLRKTAKKRPFGYPTIGAVMMSGDSEDSNVQRRSFSGAIKRHSPIKCLSSSSDAASSSSSSSSFSFNSNGSHELLRRSSSATEIEGSIEAAIAHCKKSQQQQVFEMLSM